MAEFQKYFWLCHCQAYLKDFVAYFDSGKNNNDSKFIKEKLIVCLYVLKRRSELADEIIESGAHAFKNFNLKSEEMNFLGKDAYPQPYIKYIKNEEWYISISRQYPEIRS